MTAPFTQGNPTLLIKAKAESVAFYGMAGRGATAPGALVIRKLDDTRPANYVVHFFNAQDGGYHSGSYTETLVQAFEAFTERARLYDPYGDLNKAFEDPAL